MTPALSLLCSQPRRQSSLKSRKTLQPVAWVVWEEWAAWVVWEAWVEWCKDYPLSAPHPNQFNSSCRKIFYFWTHCFVPRFHAIVIVSHITFFIFSVARFVANLATIMLNLGHFGYLFWQHIWKHCSFSHLFLNNLQRPHLFSRPCRITNKGPIFCFV